MSLPVLEAQLGALRERVQKIEDDLGDVTKAQNLDLRQQSWILGLGVGLGGAGVMLVQLIIQKVFG